MIETFIYWNGVATLIGILTLTGAAAWWFALKLIRNCLMETWWIVAWVLHCRGDRVKAKWALRAAIEHDAAKGGGE